MFFNFAIDLVLTNLETTVSDSVYGFVECDAHHPPLTVDIALQDIIVKI